MFRLALIFLLIGAAVATEVKTCKSGAKPMEVRIKDCDKLPCVVYKGSTSEMEVEFNVGDSDVESLTAKVRATALGITIPYPLPEDIADVCENLLDGQVCPLDAGEGATYLFKLPIGGYPEIGVTVEVSLKNQDDETISCFVADVNVRTK